MTLAIIAALAGIGFSILIMGLGAYMIGSIIAGMVKRAISEL